MRVFHPWQAAHRTVRPFAAAFWSTAACIVAESAAKSEVSNSRHEVSCLKRINSVERSDQSTKRNTVVYGDNTEANR
jgi:hypothetical protein